MARPQDVIRLVTGPIDVGAAYDAVRAPGCGAVVVFVGTARDVHAGPDGVPRAVASLEYEAYVPMAQRELEALAAEVHATYPAAGAVCLIHRLGAVPLAEASVVVAVATPHRREAFEACRHAIDALKVRVPIWKKEAYRDGTAPRWVANQEERAAEVTP